MKRAMGFPTPDGETMRRQPLGQASIYDIIAYHDNAAGTILLSLEKNYGHGLSSPATKYFRLGPTTGIAITYAFHV